MDTISVKTVDELRDLIEGFRLGIGYEEDYDGRRYAYIYELIGIEDLRVEIDAIEHEMMEVLNDFDDAQTGLECKFWLGNNGDDEHTIDVTYDILYIGGSFVLKNFKWAEV